METRDIVNSNKKIEFWAIIPLAFFLAGIIVTIFCREILIKSLVPGINSVELNFSNAIFPTTINQGTMGEMKIGSSFIGLISKVLLIGGLIAGIIFPTFGERTKKNRIIGTAISAGLMIIGSVLLLFYQMSFELAQTESFKKLYAIELKPAFYAYTILMFASSLAVLSQIIGIILFKKEENKIEEDE